MSTAQSPVPTAPEELHPSIWRASQLAHATTRCIDTGHPALSRELVGNGWPTGTLIDLLVSQPGIGEMRLLAPALAKVAHKSVVLIQPPQTPQAIALSSLGIGPSQLVWIKSKVSADALWAAEQTLRSGVCGAVLLWLSQVRQESLRRLHLAAQSGEALFYVLRPLSAAQDASPAPLRLSLRPAAGGINVEFVKRRGPQRDDVLFVPLLTGASPVRTHNRPHPHPTVSPTPVNAPALAASGIAEPTSNVEERPGMVLSEL